MHQHGVSIGADIRINRPPLFGSLEATVSKPIKNIIVNRKARHEYFLFETFEAGISLLGSEVKSLRDGRAALGDAFVSIEPTGAWIRQFRISTYPWANRQNHEPMRPRQLLLNKRELRKLKRGTAERGMTIIPIRVYFLGSRVKLEIALAKGKKLHDKRQSIKEKDLRREMGR